MVTRIYVGHEKEGKNFISKFPNWVFNLRNIISSSNHFKRISNFGDYANAIDKAKREKHSFIDISTQDLDTKFANRKNGTGKFMKSLKQFGKLFIGKASKTGVEQKVQEFFKRVNAPWRMWWEVVCDKNQKLSRKNAKDILKEAISQKTKVALMKLFNQPFPNAADLKLAIDKNNDAFSGDSNNAQRDQMLDVFCNLDKKLGNEARDVFGMDPVEEESFIQKVKNMLKKSKPELKRTKSMEEPKNRPNLETLEQTISSNAAPQPGGNNLTFDQNKVGKINGIFKQFDIPESGLMEKFYKGNKDLVKAKQALNAIIKLNNEIKYTPGDKTRPEFLVSVARYLGLSKFDVTADKSKGIVDIEDICKGKTTSLPKEYQNNAAILAVQRVRNLIRYGMNIGKNDKLPALS